jgi:hypothetical protein
VLHHRTSRSSPSELSTPPARASSPVREVPSGDCLGHAIEKLRGIASSSNADSNELTRIVVSKSVLFCESLVDRIEQCTNAANVLRDIGRLTPALVLTRGVVEATIMLCWLHAKVVEFQRTNDRPAFERFLASGNFEATGSSPLDQAWNVVMTVDRLDREARGFKEKFNLLCGLTDLHYNATVPPAGHLHRNGDAQADDARRLKYTGCDPTAIQNACCVLAELYVGRIVEALAHAEKGKPVVQS